MGNKKILNDKVNGNYCLGLWHCQTPVEENLMPLAQSDVSENLKVSGFVPLKALNSFSKPVCPHGIDTIFRKNFSKMGRNIKEVRDEEY